MMQTHRLFLLSLLLLGAIGQSAAPSNEPDKKALAILGDFWHAVAPLNNAIVTQLEEKGYTTDLVLDYTVPYDRLSDYDVVVISRYGVDDYTKLKEKEASPRVYSWLSPAQEDAIEAYVLNGGHLLLHHDGFGYYPKDGGISRLAKAFFIRHPPAVTITVVPVGNYAGLNTGVDPYIIKDEEYQTEGFDPAATHVFMQSYSEENGRSYQGWAHDYGEGKVVVFIPGHDRYSLANPMVLKSISNILDSFGQ